MRMSVWPGKQEKMRADEYYTSYNHRHFAYLARGKYIEQLQSWMSLFPRQQFLLLKSEDFYANPAIAYQQTLDFLKLPDTEPGGRRQFQRYNDTKSASMNSETRKRLLAYFEPYNARLYDYLGIDFGWV